MIRVSANIAKKIPVPGVEYSSQQFGASMEIEVSDVDRPEAVQHRLRELYALLSNTIDEQIAAIAAPQGQQLEHPQPRRNTVAIPNHNGRRMPAITNMRPSRSVTATDAQQRALFAICKSMNLDIATVLADYNVSEVNQLTVKDASRAIDELKSRKGSNGNHAH